MLNLKNTLDGYLKNVEVIGNTIQDETNLANIRSVGDKVEGQELYKIPVVSCGKNLFNIDSISSNIISKSDNAYEIHTRVPVDLYSKGIFKAVKNVQYTMSYKAKLGTATKFRADFVYNDGSYQQFSYCTSTTEFIQITATSDNNKQLDYIRFNWTDAGTVYIKDIQIEEGTQVTPYEPPKGDKLEILSPVQLEKVGDVADRIICKDGVWGVEKNIKTDLLKGGVNEGFGLNKVLDKGGYQFTWSANMGAIANKNSEVISSTMNSYVVSNEDYSSNIWIYSGTTYVIHHPTISTNEGIKLWLQANPTIVKFILNTPQFIPLPQDQQVKLRTFAGQTNVFFNTEIAGQIKAQVPKSLGAVVNTHTEQIEMLHNALKSVLAGDMYSLATILYPEDFVQNDNIEQDIMVIPE